MRPTGLTLVKINFCILQMTARLERLISLQTKEYYIAIMKAVYNHVDIAVHGCLTSAQVKWLRVYVR